MSQSTNTSKKILFRIITFLIPIFLVLIVEGILRVFSYGHNLDLIISHPSDQYEEYYMINPYVGIKYFNKFEPTSTTNDIFLKTKPENGFRIFVMGSSTTFGFPYDRNLMASRILHKRLSDSYPDKFVEVVNTSITAINSVTLKDYIGQILDYEPDAIILYAGHNEFYGAFGVASNERMSENSLLQNLHFKFINLRIYQLLRSTISWLSTHLASESAIASSKGTLMKRIVEDENITYHGEKYIKGIEQYRNNLNYIINECKEKKVPLLLSDLVSNIRDLPPFGDSDEEKLSAMLKYSKAQQALIDGDTSLALNLFIEAKDLDPIRFRASEEINQIIYNQVEQNNATLIPTKEWFSNHSIAGLMGDNLFTEHVHPNIDGQFVLADAFYSKIVKSKLIETTTNSLTERSKEFYRQNWKYTKLDSLMGVYVVEQLKSYWPFKKIYNEITFRDTFKTNGLIDSLAFTFLTNPDGSIDSLHKYLGEFYEKNNKMYLALKEYEAIIGINPYRSDNYNKAANLLLKLNDLHAAEKYLRESIKFVKTYFAYTLLGEIEFIKHNFNESIEAYKLALTLSEEEDIDDDDKIILLKKLYNSYKLSKNIDSQKKVKRELSELGYKSDIQEVSSKFEYSRYIPLNIKRPFSKALQNYSSNVDSALYYLNYCLSINDCPLVNFTIGNLLYQRRDKNVLNSYEKAYSGYKNDPNFLARLCIANIVNNEKAKASSILNELIECDPKNSEIKRLKALIQK